jgi:hypothetical protein
MPRTFEYSAALPACALQSRVLLAVSSYLTQACSRPSILTVESIIMSASTQAALNYLKKIKPSDGWSSEARSTGGTITTVRLLRRNVPLTESYFLDLHYDTESGNVVGILTPNRDGKAQAQILVDKNGKPQGSKTALLRVSNWTPGASPPKTTERSTSSTSRSSTGAAAAAADTSLSLEENKELLKYVAYAIGGAVAFRLIFSAMLGLYVLAFPIVYLYLVQNCPKMESFNAKKELKRVLRGVHLADDNPNKPKVSSDRECALSSSLLKSFDG